MRKCPPGVLCIENFTSLLFIIIIIIIGWFIFVSYQNQNRNKNRNQDQGYNQRTTEILVAEPNYPYNN